MKGDRITYRDIRKYKYELVEDYVLMTKLKGFSGHALQRHPTGDGPPEKRVFIKPDGRLIIKAGYLWDGPSGIARDTLTFMRGSLVHDALYHLLRDGVLPKRRRRFADALMRKVCLQDGMNPARVAAVYLAVRAGGQRSASHDKPSIVRTAPRRR